MTASERIEQPQAQNKVLPADWLITRSRQIRLKVSNWLASLRRAITPSMYPIALVLLVMSTLAFRSAVPVEMLWVGLVLFIVGTLVLGVGLWLNAERPALALPTSRPLSEGRIRWNLVAFGFVALLILAESNGNLLQSLDVASVTIHTQFLLLVVGTVAVTWGFSGMSWPRLPHIQRREALVIVLLTALAIVLRLWNVDNTVRFPVHEGFFAYTNTVIRSDPSTRLVVPFHENIPSPLVHNYVQYLGVRLFGQTWFGFRAASAFVAALTIPGLYLLARSLVDRKTAIIAALLLAVFPPHLHLSRLNLVNLFDPLFGTLSVAFLARAFRTSHRADYAIGGMALGMTQYFVDEGRLFYLGLVIVWVVGGILFWRPRPSWRGLGIALLTALIVSFPYYYTVYGLGYIFSPRAETEGLSYWKQIIADGQYERAFEEMKFNLSSNYLHYLHNYDRPLLWLFYGGEQPLLLLWIVPFFLLGMAYSLWRWRRPVGSLLLIWVISAPLGISLVSTPGSTVRFAVVLPVMALVIAVGLHFLYPLMANMRFRAAALGVLVGAMAFGQFNYYFNDHLTTYNQQLRQWYMGCGDAMDALIRSSELPPRSWIYVVSSGIGCEPWESSVIMAYFREDVTLAMYPSDVFTDDYLERYIPRTVDVAFFLWPQNYELSSASLGTSLSMAHTTATFPLRARARRMSCIKSTPIQQSAPATTSRGISRDG